MKRRDALLAPAAMAVLAALLLAAAGCGEKIAIPHASGLFSVNLYVVDEEYADPDARQILAYNGYIFVAGATELRKRNLNYEDLSPAVVAGGLGELTALAVAPGGSGAPDYVFVWDQGANLLRWFNATDLSPAGSAALPGVQSVQAIGTNASGIGQVPGARTYLYLADSTSTVVHRFSFDDFNGPLPHGILTMAEGSSARSVHQARGMGNDSEGRLLVCDADTTRNWVIRFDPEPDLEDVTPATNDSDPLRGLVVEFNVTCEPPAPADYVLGLAAACGQSDWVGGTSSAKGGLNAPSAVAADGSGRLFVADTGNNRVSVFDRFGGALLLFGTADNCPAPTSLGVVDLSRDRTYYGAYVFVHLPGAGRVTRFISDDFYRYDRRAEPPRP